MPHISVHRPTNAPLFWPSGRLISLTWKMLSELFALGSGSTSRLNRNSGTQKPWITSAEAIWNSIRLPAGTTSTGISVDEPSVSTLSKFRYERSSGFIPRIGPTSSSPCLSTPSGLEIMASLRAASAPS